MPSDPCPGCKRERVECVCLFGPPRATLFVALLLCSCASQPASDRILSAIERAKQACVLYETVPDIPRDVRVDEACKALTRVEVVPDGGTEALVPPS